MICLPITVEVNQDSETKEILRSISQAIRNLSGVITAFRFKFSISMEGLMVQYKADEPDFDFRLVINGLDSEGNVIHDIEQPVGSTLVIVSDNPDAFTVTQDLGDARLVHAHVGVPNADGSPATANLSVTLTDSDSNLIGSGTEQVVVTTGDFAGTIASIEINLPSPTV